jgi:hypothetical protein
MHQEAFSGEDISDRPLPEVTEPFWNWLFDQDPRISPGSDSLHKRSAGDWPQERTTGDCRKRGRPAIRSKREGRAMVTSVVERTARAVVESLQPLSRIWQQRVSDFELPPTSRPPSHHEARGLARDEVRLLVSDVECRHDRTRPLPG